MLCLVSDDAQWFGRSGEAARRGSRRSAQTGIPNESLSGQGAHAGRPEVCQCNAKRAAHLDALPQELL